MKRQLTGFGMVMTALVVLVTVAVVGALAWFGFRFVQDEILDGEADLSPEDEELRNTNLAGCIDMARKIKGTGISYGRFQRIAPFCGSIVTRKIWGEL